MIDIKKLILLFFILNLLCSLVFAQSEVRKYILMWVEIWWLFFISGLILIVIGIVFRNRDRSRWLMEAGFIIAGFGLLFAEFAYILPSIIWGPKINYKVCEKTFISTGSVKDIFLTASCIFIGYAPVELSIYSILVFIIFLLILPLAMLISLFWDFSGFLTHPGVRKVIAFSSALISYRMLVSTFLIEFLSYGLGGIGLLFFNYLLFGWGITIIRRMFALQQQVKLMREVSNLARLNRLLELRDNLRRAQEMATLSGDMKKVRKIEEEIRRIETLIEELKKK